MRVLFFLAALAVHNACFSKGAEVALDYDPARGQVEAVYTFESPTRQLRFALGSDIRRLSWALPAGAELSEDGTTITWKVPSITLRVGLKVLPRDGGIDRIHAPVVHFGDGQAALVFSDYLVPMSGGKLVLRPGSQVRARRVDGRGASWDANSPATYVLLGHASTERAGAARLTFDAALPRWIQDRIRSTSQRLLEQYAIEYDRRPATAPWVLATRDASSLPGPAFRGERLDDLIRLNFIGPSWAAPTEGLLRTIDAFLAHEFHHLWTNQLWQPRAGTHFWVHEGGSDAAAAAVLVRAGLATREQYSQDLSRSLTACAAARGDTLASKLEAGGRVPYHCGAALFFLQAAWNGGAPDASALTVWREAFRRSGPNGRYAVADLFPEAPGPSTLSQFVRGSARWEQLSLAAQQAGLVRAAGEEDLRDPQVAPFALEELVFSAVKADCGGAISVGYENLVFTIFPLESCRTIKETRVVSHLGGHAMAQDPTQAVDYAIASCGQSASLELSDKEGRHTLTLPCPATRLSASKVLLPTPRSPRP